MPRPTRQIVPGYPQHVIVRGIDRSTCFFGPDDFAAYLAWLLRLSREHDCELHAFVLMTNHVHAMLTPGTTDALSTLMQRLGRRYAGRVNHARGRTGPLFEGRYRSQLIASDQYALACLRYIDLNPVRAGMVTQARDYRWSSVCWHLSGRGPPGWRPHASYLALGSDGARRARAYHELLAVPIAGDAVRAIRPGAPVARPGPRVSDALASDL